MHDDLTTENIDAELTAQAAAIAEETLAEAGVTVPTSERRMFVHALQSRASVLATFTKGSQAQVLAECARVNRAVAARRFAHLDPEA